jgi:hypothetical protein
MAWCSVKKKSTGTTLPLPFVGDMKLEWVGSWKLASVKRQVIKDDD